jgi:hypothetical protein
MIFFTHPSFMKRKWIKYILRALFACIITWILLLLIAFVYIRKNKGKIIASIKSSLDKRISGKIDFTGLSVDFFQNFPGISVDLKNIQLRDSLFQLHKKELLHVQHLYVGFGIFNLFSSDKTLKYLTFSNGSIFLFADSAGNKNWNILKSQTGTKKAIDLKKISFENINVIFEDKSKFKYYNVVFEKMKCTIRRSDNKIRFEMNNRAIIKIVAFNTKIGGYLANKRLISQWSILYDKDLKKIALQDQLVKINGQSYRLTGNFFLNSSPYFNLSIRTTDLSLKEAGSIFPVKTERRINQFQLSKPLKKVQAYLTGSMKYLSLPFAKINFSVNDASLSISPVNFEHCSFNGFFNNRVDPVKPRDDRNSMLQFTDVKGEWEKNAFNGKDISFYNLIEPYLKCDIHFVFKVAQLEKAIASRRLDFNSGDGEAVINYAGPVSGADTTYDLNGRVTIHKGDITYNPRNLNFKKTEMELSFEKGDVLVKKMNTEINNSDISIKGRINDFLNFFKTDSSKATFEWTIYSSRLDIGKLKSSLHRSSSAKNKHSYSFFEKLSNKIDRLFDDCNAYLTIRADKLVYKNFLATKVKGKLSLTNEMLRLDNFSLEHAGGILSVNASSKDNGNTSDLFLQSKMKNVNIKELFSSFNNFGMESLTSKNISGNFSADINLTSRIDANNDLYRPANKGYIDFSLKHGRLENFKPLIEIDNNFLQKRNLNDVSFAELKDRLDLNGNDIYMHRMEIKSTAVNMYVEGIYSFANNTDLSIQIPLHRQKKDQHEVPENKGVKAKTGISIFLRAKDDKDGKLKINYDLLGRFRSKN